jgi:DNA-binding CsgD family transcriptional regulator
MARAVRARHPEPPIILLLRGEPSIEAQERALTLDAFWMPYAVSGDAMRLHIERTFQRRNQRARSIAGAIRSTGGLTCCEEEHLFHVLCGRSSKTVAVTACISPRTVSVHRTRAFAKAGRENIGDWIAASSRNVWDHADAVEAESVERISRVRIRPVDVREESETSTAHRECDAVVPVFPRRP